MKAIILHSITQNALSITLQASMVSRRIAVHLDRIRFDPGNHNRHMPSRYSARATSVRHQQMAQLCLLDNAVPCQSAGWSSTQQEAQLSHRNITHIASYRAHWFIISTCVVPLYNVGHGYDKC